MSTTPEIIVAGHICLDIIPTGAPPPALWQPGKLLEVGRAVMATGGTVANTGIALHRLGIRTRLMGKVGDDMIGRAILDLLRGVDPSLAEGMIVARGEASSYTVVLNPPNVDRMFLHCPGANDTFAADDVDDEKLAGAKLFHFGYPPLMRKIYSDGGRELERLFRRVKARGLTTSLDMVMVDPNSDAGRVDWVAYLQRVLPVVDVFLPSLDEIQWMLRRPTATPRELAEQLHAWGAGIVGLKLGSEGLYVRWPDQERTAPCFVVDVVGTTGAGDCTIAGFLAGLVRGLPADEVMTQAVAVGAFCCEAADATSGVRSLAEVQRRIQAGWPRLLRLGQK